MLELARAEDGAGTGDKGAGWEEAETWSVGWLSVEMVADIGERAGWRGDKHGEEGIVGMEQCRAV